MLTTHKLSRRDLFRMSAVGLAGGISPLLSQSRAAHTDYIGQSALPSVVRIHAERLGDRVFAPGKERLLLSGVLTDAAGGQSPAALIYQLPNMVRLQAAGSLRNLVFDGTAARATGTIGSSEEAVLESLTDDTMEGFLDSIRNGSSVRLLGRNFRPEGSLGSGVDIYDVRGPARSRRDRIQRQKRFYFDNTSALLLRVRYNDASRGLTETRFSQWRDVNAAAVPGVIERLENDRPVFVFRLTTAEVQSKGDDRIFRDPT